jgi:CheY-like chemotaxis protein
MADRKDRVLIVEDNAILAIVLARILESGFTTARASTVAEGLARLDEAPFDVILCDFALDDGDGAALLEAARRKQAAAIRVIMSGGYVPGLEALESDGVVEAALWKPITRDSFEAAIARVRAERAR